ncbi:MAG: RdgB/HAM1 family non-canonical purine NTP pyrophosphatase [Anaerolineaceae bacterium]|jgi:XTP/dITP diphosphohydrolase|nr:RdgB/HAM1 family non-canonical purine NTP pyrophosphatase [Anaerolineaceae bacterium]OQY89543.1 MAG: non-canonical purine NTP pyrophosphatase, RdgB/HAM1 family [Anaerolineae bacterium UTCFX1]
MLSLLLATNNKDKIAELQILFKDLNVQLVTPADIRLELDVVEDGRTYAENASKKASAFAQASGLLSLADDSGLEVDALHGEPGLYSARYGSTNDTKLSAPERRKYLIGKLSRFSRPWKARFKATIAIADMRSCFQIVEGVCEGEIISEERGAGGFGYDPIFLLSEMGRTMAELSIDEKNRLSHRAKAAIKAKDLLRRLAET